MERIIRIELYKIKLRIKKTREIMAIMALGVRQSDLMQTNSTVRSITRLESDYIYKSAHFLTHR